LTTGVASLATGVKGLEVGVEGLMMGVAGLATDVSGFETGVVVAIRIESVLAGVAVTFSSVIWAEVVAFSARAEDTCCLLSLSLERWMILG
jgi:hypothetical protein